MSEAESSINPARSAEVPGVSAAPVARKRGAKFWLVRASIVLVALCVLLFCGAWAYINLGFLNSTIAQTLSKRMGTTAHVGAVKTTALQNLSIENIVIDPTGKSGAVSIGATKLDFNLYELLSANHLRSVTIEDPNINVSYDPAKGWSPALKLSSEQGAGTRIDRFELKNGTLSLAWPNSGFLKLSKINASMGQKDGGATAFNVNAETASHEKLTVDGINLSGGGFKSHTVGALNIERDAPFLAQTVPGLGGVVRYDFNSKREPRAISTTAIPQTVFDGQIDIANFNSILPVHVGGAYGPTGSGSNSASGALKIGDVGAVSFQIEDISALSKNPTDASNLNISALQLDIGKFFETAIGQKMLAEPGADAAHNPYVILGKLSAPHIDIEAVVADGDSKNTILQVKGLTLNGLAVKKWPLDFALPEFKITGPISARIECENKVPKSVALNAQLHGESPANKSLMSLFQSPTPKLAGKFQANLAPGVNGAWAFTTISVRELSIPLAPAGSILRLMENAGVRLDGAIISDEVQYDLATGTASGTLKLKGAEVRFSIPQPVRDALNDMLIKAGYANYSMAINSITESGVKKIAGEFTFRASGTSAEVNGKLAVIPVFATGLGAIDFEEFALPGCTVAMKMNQAPDGTLNTETTLTTEEHTQLSIHSISRADGRSIISAALKTESRDGDTLVMAFDSAKNIDGPITLTTQGFDLAQLQDLYKSPSDVKTGPEKPGSIRNLTLRMKPFSTDPRDPHILNLQISVGSATYGAFTIPTQEVNLQIDETGVILQSPFKWLKSGAATSIEAGPIPMEKLMQMMKEVDK